MAEQLLGLGRAGLVTGKHSVIRAEPATMGIVGGEQAALQHLVGGGPVSPTKCADRRPPSNFGETVSVIRIQHDSANQQVSRSAVVSMRRAPYQIQTGCSARSTCSCATC